MWPEIEIICVPGLLGVPVFLNSAAPRRRITGTLASVSTLFTTVGFWYSPFTVSRGGRLRGQPFLPSSDASMADASPHTYDPAPRYSTTSSE